MDYKNIIYSICTNQSINEEPFIEISNKLLKLTNCLNTNPLNYYLGKYINEELYNLYNTIKKLNDTKKIYLILEIFLNRKDIQEIYNYLELEVNNVLPFEANKVNELQNISIIKNIELWVIFGCTSEELIYPEKYLSYSTCEFDKFNINLKNKHTEYIYKSGKFIYFIRKFNPFFNNFFILKNSDFLNENNLQEIYLHNYLLFNNYFFINLKNEINKIKKYIFFCEEYNPQQSEHVQISQSDSFFDFFNLPIKFNYPLENISIKFEFKYIKIFLSKSNYKELEMIFRIFLFLNYFRRKVNFNNSIILEQFINLYHLNRKNICSDCESLIINLKEEINFILRNFFVIKDKFYILVEMVKCMIRNEDISYIIELIQKEEISLELRIFLEQLNYKDYIPGDV